MGGAFGRYAGRQRVTRLPQPRFELRIGDISVTKKKTEQHIDETSPEETASQGANTRDTMRDIHSTLEKHLGPPIVQEEDKDVGTVRRRYGKAARRRYQSEGTVRKNVSMAPSLAQALEKVAAVKGVSASRLIAEIVSEDPDVAAALADPEPD